MRSWLKNQTVSAGLAGDSGALDVEHEERPWTAVSRDSRAWFTLSHGILNEIYYPRVDHACMLAGWLHG